MPIHPNLLHEGFEAEITPRILHFAKNGSFTIEQVEQDAFLKRLLKLRDWTLDNLNSWLACHLASDRGVSQETWALEEVKPDAVFGPTAKIIENIIRKYLPLSNFKGADFGAGTAKRTLLLAKEFEKSEFIAFEPAKDMYNIAKANIFGGQLSNVQLEALTSFAAKKDFTNTFDLAISILSAHFSRSLEEHFASIRACMKTDGILITREFLIPAELSRKAQRFLAEYHFRMASIRHPPLKEIEYIQLWQRCGFKLIDFEFDTGKQGGGAIPTEKPAWLIKFIEELAKECEIDESDLASALSIKKIAILQATS